MISLSSLQIPPASHRHHMCNEVIINQLPSIELISTNKISLSWLPIAVHVCYVPITISPTSNYVVSCLVWNCANLILYAGYIWQYKAPLAQVWTHTLHTTWAEHSTGARHNTTLVPLAYWLLLRSTMFLKMSSYSISFIQNTFQREYIFMKLNKTFEYMWV